jgi:hypothetical protein
VDVVSSEMQRVAQKHEGKLQPTWERWGHTAPGQHGPSAQTPEEKPFELV